MTTLVEARLLAGNAELFADDARGRVAPTASGRSRHYFEAKVAEQQDRHLKANDTAYNLEPNVKTGPGGLRDIQTIALGGQAPLRRELARRAADARLPVRRPSCASSSRRSRSCGRCASACTCSPAGAKTGCCSITRSASRRASATKTPRTRSRSSSSCSATTAPSWTSCCSTNCCCSCSAKPSSPRPRRRGRSTPRFQVRNEYLEAVNEELFARTPSTLLELFVVLQQNPEVQRRARLDHPRGQQEPVAHRRGVPPEPAQPPPVPRDPARARRRDARAAPHEHLRRARPLHPGVRPHRRPHAVRPVPRVHRRRAHAVRVEQPAPPVAAEVRPRAAAALGHHAAAAEARDRLPRGAVPRHRQGPRRRSLAARLRRRRGVLPGAGPVALRRAPGRLAGAEPPRAVGHRAEAGHLAIPRSSTRSRARSATRPTSTIYMC